MSLCNNIKKFRKLNNYTQKDMALKLNVSQPLIVKWEKDICEPKTNDLQSLADLFSIPVDLLLNNTPVFSNAQTYEVNPEQILRPILGVVKAGYNMYCEQNIIGYKAVDKSKAKGAECFWLKVTGDSMNAVGILEGSLVLVKKVMVENKQIGVVRINGDEATMKQVVFKDDTVILQPEKYYFLILFILTFGTYKYYNIGVR